MRKMTWAFQLASKSTLINMLTFIKKSNANYTTRNIVSQTLYSSIHWTLCASFQNNTNVTKLFQKIEEVGICPNSFMRTTIPWYQKLPFQNQVIEHCPHEHCCTVKNLAFVSYNCLSDRSSFVTLMRWLRIGPWENLRMNTDHQNDQPCDERVEGSGDCIQSCGQWFHQLCLCKETSIKKICTPKLSRVFCSWMCQEGDPPDSKRRGHGSSLHAGPSQTSP